MSGETPPPPPPPKILLDPPPDIGDPPGRYWDTLLDLLWPRFEHILELHIQSIQSTDPQRLGFLDTRPHYVRRGVMGGGACVLCAPSPNPDTPPQITRRYAEFSSAIVSINQTFPNEKVNALLGQLQVVWATHAPPEPPPPPKFFGGVPGPSCCDTHVLTPSRRWRWRTSCCGWRPSSPPARSSSSSSSTTTT